ncbi:HNH endonuclease [Aureimonas glaciei]|uniref:AP2/ERF domain-containing protein n=1 Tax=Aureimonas glaciei TaxID=1776957 RepID=A0A917DEZ1_9HYPH|nr:HNH endonuclease [Aureimonas glaciei]GGD31569.1 hypothetical protein GCM10011335_38280 [Aureimonas glaciei]
MPKIKNQDDIDVSRFSYDPDTGVVTWLDGQCKGKAVGTKTERGYLAATIQGKGVLVHRLAWRIHYGKWPEQIIDHKDGVKDRNVLDNMRLATDQQNKWNIGKPVTNTTGFKGVTFDAKRAKPWRAMIKQDGKTRHLGSYNTAEEAAAAYDRAANELHEDHAQTNRMQRVARPFVEKKVQNATGKIGVTRAMVRGLELFQASITDDGKRRYLGRYLTKEDAAMAYDRAAWPKEIAYTGTTWASERRRYNEPFWALARLGFDEADFPVPVRV